MSSALAVFMLGSRLHVVTYLFFVILKVYSTNEGHSGFEVHWSPLRIIPFANGTSHHDFHHSKNVGNYGGYTYIWDYLTDNMSEYIKYHYYQSEPAAQ
jgi:sterol desaturase/sphingolipid hydroxylase (fatty acid hydroxylase superfamily)